MDLNRRWKRRARAEAPTRASAGGRSEFRVARLGTFIARLLVLFHAFPRTPVPARSPPSTGNAGPTELIIEQVSSAHEIKRCDEHQHSTSRHDSTTKQEQPPAMTSVAALPARAPVAHASEENWDEDFVFNASNSPRRADGTRLSSASSAPRKRPSVAFSETENWDDEFQDNDNEPGPSSRPSHSQRRSMGSMGATLENWDDEFEDRSPRKSTSAPRHARDESWDSDDEPHVTPSRTQRRPLPAPTFVSDDEGDTGGADFGLQDEDLTVTSNTTRYSIPDASTLPALPGNLSPTHPVPIPGSPALSSFSATLSYTAPSQYSSTHHLALRPTQSAGSSNHAHGRAFVQQPGVLRKPPPSTSQNPTRARRRLRKKSRPSRVGEDIFEMEDRTGAHDDDEDYQRARAMRLQQLAGHVNNFTSTEDDLDELPDEDEDTGYVSPVTPDPRVYHQVSSRPQSVSSNILNGRPNRSQLSFTNGTSPSSTIPVSGSSPPSNSIATSPTRSPLLQRLGSVKRWAKGSRRLSTVPSDPATTPGTGFELSRGPTRGHSQSGRPLSFVGQQERTRSPLGEHRNQSLHELRPISHTASQNAQNANSSHSPHPDESKAGSKSWFFHKDGAGGGHGRKGRDKLKDTTSTASGDEKHGVEQCSPNGGGAAFPRRGPDPELEHMAKDHEVKERRGLLGLRRISLLGGHRRHKSVAEDSIPPTSPLAPNSKQALAGFQFPPPDKPVQCTTPPRVRATPPSPPNKKTPQRLTISNLELVSTPSRSAASNLKYASANGQAASLGRSSTPTIEAQRELALRRNSLGDLKLEGGLKIPARISRAQVNLKRDLVLVKEFAICVDVLQQQQYAYKSLVNELRLQTEATSPTSESSSSTRMFHRSGTSRRHSEDPSRKLLQIEQEYGVWWECADILIELGGKPRDDQDERAPRPDPALVSGRSTPRSDADSDSTGRKRERAVTVLGGQAPLTPTVGPPPASPPDRWHASTGRNDLSQRQLQLLKRMLNTPDPSTFVVGGMVAVARPVRDQSSATTLAAADSTVNSAVGGPNSELVSDPHYTDAEMRLQSPSSIQAQSSPHEKVRRGSKSIIALRDFLRTFRRYGHSIYTIAPSHHPPATISRTDLGPADTATASSASMSVREQQHQPHENGEGTPQRKLRSSTGAQVVVSEQERKEAHPNSPYGTAGAALAKTPRRPSLASLFRLASGKGKIVPQPNDSRRSEDADSSEWDRMESVSDFDLAAAASPDAQAPVGLDTVRGGRKAATYEGLSVTPSTTKHLHNRSRSVSRNRGAAASRSSLNIALPSTPVPKAGGLRNRIFRKADSKEATPPPAPSQAFAHAASVNGVSPSHGDATSTEDSEAHQHGRERSATAPSRRPAGSRSVSANHVPSNSVPAMPAVDALPPLPDLRLAMTPENIQPLLHYAKEVSARLSSCVAELRSALPRHSTSSATDASTDHAASPF